MQRLLLTSKGFANEAIKEAFLSLLPALPEDLRIAVIPTAAKELKGKHPHILAASEHLQNLGFRAIEIVDVEDKEKAALLYSYDVLYLGGGNPFRFCLTTIAKMSSLEKILLRNVYKNLSAIVMFLSNACGIMKHFF